jgi:IS4 transposase
LLYSRGHQVTHSTGSAGRDPAFLYISDGKLNEINVLDFLPIEAGSFYVMDRGYLDFRRLFAMHQAGAFFVTRARSAMDARRVYSGTADRNHGVICDQRVMFNGRSTSKKYPERLRRIRFKDPDSGKTLVFLTNNTALPALTIAALYKSRWQIELFFKWIKQHLRIKRFLATSENAVKTQI